MRRLSILSTALLLGATLAVGAPSPASAASTDYGNGCEATSPGANVTVLMTGHSVANPLPVGAPQTGIVTKVKVRIPGAAVGVFPTKLKMARPTGAPNGYTILAESGVLSVGPGLNTFDVRVPVTAGDLLGLGGANVLICTTGQAGDTVVSLASDQPAGSTGVYSAPMTSTALAVVATVEPDADKDGFGDDTQDGCPQSPSFQGQCPVVVLDSFAASAGSSITVVVSTNNSASVKLTGKAKVNGKTIKLKGGTKLVKPGALTKFNVKLPQSLRSALKALPPSKRIKVTLTAAATDVIGRVSTSKSNVKLPGTR